MHSTITKYIAALNRQRQTGQATEHTYRSALEGILKDMLPLFTVTNEAKRRACGAPDFVLFRNDVPVSYIETKDINDSDLEGRNKNKKQFIRYKDSLDNIIFTDYLEFLHYEKKEKKIVNRVRIAELDGDKIKPIKEHFSDFKKLIERFGKAEPQAITSSTQLAAIMAKKACLMAEVIEKVLTNGQDSDNKKLASLMKTFKEVLIHDLTPKKFADVYAQTIAYGMFATWQQPNALPGQFNRQTVAQLIPNTNPLLRKLFQDIAGYDLDKRIRWIVDDLAEAFRVANVKEVMKDFDKRTSQTDPMIHFYETFLTKYDPKERKNRGGWYTPKSVVQFIVRSVDKILQQEFGLAEGLADTTKISALKNQNDPDAVETEVHRVQILDPAAGTGAFLVETVSQIRETIQRHHGRGMWQGYVQEHLIPRLNGFEVLMAPYTLAHLNLGLTLNQRDYESTGNERFQIYLTNSLEDQDSNTRNLFYELAHEVEEANRIKRVTPVMVIIGNPPYNGKSQNKGKWITDRMKNYKKEPNTNSRLKNERNSKWINNDYCKFIRLGQFLVGGEKGNAEGVLAYINSNSFIDSPTFRGMRWSLLKTFDKIYILDLHGNSHKKETAPGGGTDENVFKIKEGVSINIFIKTGHKKENDLAKVFHFDLYGKQAKKYEFLSHHTLQTMSSLWREVKLAAPQYFFTKKKFSQSLQREYEKGFSVQELFPVNSVGIVTARDHFSIQNTVQEVKNTINEFIKLDIETARDKFDLGNDVRDWSVAGAKKDLTTHPDFSKIVEINYRPFDIRFTYYTGNSKGFHCMPRGDVMQHFLKGKNVGLVVSRQAITNNWSHVQVANTIIDNRIHYSNKGIPLLIPLYLYPESPKLLGNENGRKPNLNEAIVNEMCQRLGMQFTDEKQKNKNSFSPFDVLDYIYAVLHCPLYRERYKEFLKIDFPRIPYPEDAERFWKLVKLGEKLRHLHLMEEVNPQQGLAVYDVPGSHVVENKKEDLWHEDGQVWINTTQFFDNVPFEVWNFYIGGYQPAQKWLEDRRGQALSYDDRIHYRKIIHVLNETRKVMDEIARLS